MKQSLKSNNNFTRDGMAVVLRGSSDCKSIRMWAQRGAARDKAALMGARSALLAQSLGGYSDMDGRGAQLSVKVSQQSSS